MFITASGGKHFVIYAAALFCHGFDESGHFFMQGMRVIGLQADAGFKHRIQHHMALFWVLVVQLQTHFKFDQAWHGSAQGFELLFNQAGIGAAVIAFGVLLQAPDNDVLNHVYCFLQWGESRLFSA